MTTFVDVGYRGTNLRVWGVVEQLVRNFLSGFLILGMESFIQLVDNFIG